MPSQLDPCPWHILMRFHTKSTPGKCRSLLRRHIFDRTVTYVQKHHTALGAGIREFESNHTVLPYKKPTAGTAHDRDASKRTGELQLH